MPQLKCIGGECDGMTQRIPDGERYADVMKTLGIAASFRVPPGGGCAIVENPPRYRYTRRVVRFGDGAPIEFLAPENWTDEHAVRQALGCSPDRMKNL